MREFPASGATIAELQDEVTRHGQAHSKPLYTDHTLSEACEMRFFETDEGSPHVGRICALLYTLALVPGCDYFVSLKEPQIGRAHV